MATTGFQQNQYTKLKNLVYLYPVVEVTAAVDAPILQKRTFTAMGATSVAPSSSLGAAPTSGVGYAYGDGAGTKLVRRDAQGQWVFQFSDSYLYLVGVSIAQFASTTGISTILGVGVRLGGATDVTANYGVGTGGYIGIELYDESGAADPGAIGDRFTFEIILGNSSAP